MVGVTVPVSSVRTRGKLFPFKSVSRAQQNQSIGRNRLVGPKQENPGYDGVADSDTTIGGMVKVDRGIRLAVEVFH